MFSSLLCSQLLWAFVATAVNARNGFFLALVVGLFAVADGALAGARTRFVRCLPIFGPCFLDQLLVAEHLPDDFLGLSLCLLLECAHDALLRPLLHRNGR